MNQARINLLKKNEQRHQGAISRKFILMAAVVAPILVMSIVSGIKVIQYSGVQSDLRQSREIWSDLEPRLELFKEENRGLVLNQKALDLFDGWQASQASFSKLLTDLQETVPETIQFTRLSVKSDLTKSVYASAKDMQLSFSLSIAGNATGEEADNHVINLRRDLLDCEQIGSTFDSIKLASLRKRTDAEGDAIRVFELVGEAMEGGRK